MNIGKIIRVDSITVIDRMDVISYDIVISCGISSRGLVKESHIERTLVLFNKFKIKLKNGTRRKT